MVVMCVDSTSAIQGFSLFTSDDVDVPIVREGLKGSIDRCESKLDPGIPEIFEELLRGSKTCRPIESIADSCSLASVLYSSHSSIPMTATPAISANAWRIDLPGSGSLCSSGIRSVAAM